MNDMRTKSIEQLMSVLDELLGGDVKERMKEILNKDSNSEMESEKEGPMHEKAEGSKVEKVEDVLENAMGEESSGEYSKPKGVGMEVSKVEVAAMPKPGLMRKMRGMK